MAGGIRIFLTTLFTVVFKMALAATAFANEGVSHGSFMSEWGWRIINFSVMVFVIVYFGGKYIRQFFADRTQKIEGEIKNSEAAIEDAKKALAEVEVRIKDRDAEAKAIVDAARENGEQEKARLITEGQKAADEIVRQAETRISLELKKAKDAIRIEAASMAVQMAEELLKKHITEGDQKKMVDDYLASVGGGR